MTPAAVARPWRVFRLFGELAWMVVFALAIPLAVLAIGVPVALLVRLAFSLLHVR